MLFGDASYHGAHMHAGMHYAKMRLYNDRGCAGGGIADTIL